jgi:uroporphyrinogen decarboxylase
MTPKQRLAAALAHEEPDRCPLDLWLTPEVEAALKLERGIDDPFELRAALGHDLLLKIVGQVASFYLSDEAEYVDAWGILWRRMQFPGGQGSYTEMVGHPLAGEDSRLASYRPPDPNEPTQYAGVAELVARWGETHAIVGGVLGSAFEGPWYLRGMDQFLTDMLLNKDYAHALTDLVADWNLVAGLKLVELGCDLILAGDDVGVQDRMLISPQLFREFVKPRYGRLFGAYKKANPRIKIATHICGYIEPILDDLVEIGVAAVNPLQPEHMDAARIRRRFGSRLALWGTVGRQTTFAFADPGEIRREVQTRIATLGRAGLVLCPAYDIDEPDVPWANIAAFLEAGAAGG